MAKILLVPTKIAPICLFGVDFADFEYGYVAGFGSSNFASNCWTSKRGPNPFEQCQPEFQAGEKKYSVRGDVTMHSGWHVMAMTSC